MTWRPTQADASNDATRRKNDATDASNHAMRRFASLCAEISLPHPDMLSFSAAHTVDLLTQHPVEVTARRRSTNSIRKNPFPWEQSKALKRFTLFSKAAKSVKSSQKQWKAATSSHKDSGCLWLLCMAYRSFQI